MAQIEINQKNIVVSEGQMLSEIPEFINEYNEIAKKESNPKVWLKKMGEDSAILLTSDGEGAFTYEVQNGDVILIEQLARYGQKK